MTTTATTTDRRPEPGPVPSRLYGVALLAGQVLLVIGLVVYLAFEEGINNGIVGGTIGAWACFALMIGYVGLARWLEPVAPRGATALLVIAVFAWVAGAMFQAQAIHQGYFGHHTDYLNTVIEDGGNAFGFLAYIPWGWCYPLSYVVAGVLLWRTRTAPNWSAVALIIGGIIVLAGTPLEFGPVAMVGVVVNLVGITPVALSIIASTQRVHSHSHSLINS